MSDEHRATLLELGQQLLEIRRRCKEEGVPDFDEWINDLDLEITETLILGQPTSPRRRH